ncbi:rhodanese-like domain-containing protein [Desulfolithobacter sp.]
MFRTASRFSTLLLLFVAFLTFPENCQSEERISGRIVSGYRILTVPPMEKTYDFTVYRGDYIKFRYDTRLGPLLFSMPELGYRQTVRPDPGKSPYFKMKKTGSYAYTLGDYTGTIRVIELVRANYTAVDAAQGAKILANLKPFILDVRTPQEYAQLAIKGAYLLPIQLLQARIGDLEAYKNEDIFVYCATGNRSTVASKILTDHGFKRIYNLRYGIYDWARRGYPVVHPGPR